MPYEAFTRDSYDKIITSYVKKSSERALTGYQLKRLFDFINDLRPEIKRQFLSSVINTNSGGDHLQHALANMSADEIIKLLSTINDQSSLIPESLKNVLDKFSMYKYGDDELTCLEKEFISDDILLSPEITNLLSTANFGTFVSDEYRMDIQHILRYQTPKTDPGWIRAYEEQLGDTCIDMLFHQTLMEVILSYGTDILSDDEIKFIGDSIGEQLQQFVETGQYKYILETLTLLESNIDKHHIQNLTNIIIEFCHSSEFLLSIVDSFKTIGRQMRDDAILLCKYYGEKIVSLLINSLISEESRAVRRFLLTLIIHLGNLAISEAEKHLNDKRWYVQRNMLYILYRCGNEEVLLKARAYCRHENSKVRFEAIKCLLSVYDSHGISALRENLQSDSKYIVKKAVDLARVFRLKETVPDLVALIKKRAITGVDFEDKIYIVRALGQIGGAEAIETLNKILSQKTVLFKGSLEKLKDEIRNILNTQDDGLMKRGISLCQK